MILAATSDQMTSLSKLNLPNQSGHFTIVSQSEISTSQTELLEFYQSAQLSFVGNNIHGQVLQSLSVGTPVIVDETSFCDDEVIFYQHQMLRRNLEKSQVATQTMVSKILSLEDLSFHLKNWQEIEPQNSVEYRHQIIQKIQKRAGATKLLMEQIEAQRL